MRTAPLIASGLFLMANAAMAAHADYYLKFDAVGRDPDGPTYLKAHSSADLDGDGLADDVVIRMDCTAGTLHSADFRVTGPRDAASGQATGKRQHKPFVARGYYDQASPPPSGSLTVLASGSPCRVGARYPSIALSGGGKNYVLQDVQVVDCGSSSAAGPEERITFVYGTVSY